MTSLADYIKAFTKLRVARAKEEKAPHKPVLLLSVMDAIEASEISDNKVFITPGTGCPFQIELVCVGVEQCFCAEFFAAVLSSEK
jgi:predicted restriction endonuclease